MALELTFPGIIDCNLLSVPQRHLSPAVLSPFCFVSSVANPDDVLQMTFFRIGPRI